MRKVCTKMVQKNLTTEQKANRRDRLEREPEFFSCIITGEESWILEYNPETKRQSWERHTANSPHPKKERMSKSKIKSMFICFFDSQGIVHKESVPSINQTFYQEVQEKGGTCGTRHCTHLDAARRQSPMSNSSLHQ